MTYCVPGTVPNALPRLPHFILKINPFRQFIGSHLLEEETEVGPGSKVTTLLTEQLGCDLRTGCLTAPATSRTSTFSERDLRGPGEPGCLEQPSFRLRREDELVLRVCDWQLCSLKLLYSQLVETKKWRSLLRWFSVWFPDQQHQCHLGTCQKCKYSGFAPNPLNQ